MTNDLKSSGKDNSKDTSLGSGRQKLSLSTDKKLNFDISRRGMDVMDRITSNKNYFNSNQKSNQSSLTQEELELRMKTAKNTPAQGALLKNDLDATLDLDDIIAREDALPDNLVNLEPTISDIVAPSIKEKINTPASSALKTIPKALKKPHKSGDSDDSRQQKSKHFKKDHKDNKDTVKNQEKARKIDKYGIGNFIVHEKEDLEDDIDTKEYDRLYGSALKVSHHSLIDAQPAQKKKRLGSNESRYSVKKDVVFNVEIGDSVVVSDLAESMCVKSKDLIKSLFKMGIIVTPNNTIDGDVAQLVAEEMGRVVVRKNSSEESEVDAFFEKSQKDLESRDPVIAIMGHVDHGKTSLLDAIRGSNIVAGESGGITQKISAYSVSHNGRNITFIDTPGHSAFEEMRARGANVTDIAILVVAGDDGIMPQTVEAIKHIQKSGAAMIVAVNKMDKPEFNLDLIKSNLMTFEVVPEEFGGNTMIVPISAKNKTNIDKLLDAILLQAEVMELKANRKEPAKGIVLESRVDKGFGASAFVLVHSGKLQKGDIFVSGSAWGRVKTISDSYGATVKDAYPSMIVEVVGFKSLPNAGDKFAVVASEKDAYRITDFFKEKEMQMKFNSNHTRISNINELFEQAIHKESSHVHDINLLVKSDLDGSLAATLEMLKKIKHPEIAIKIIGSGVGVLTESDVDNAIAANATVLLFNTGIDSKAKKLAENAQLSVQFFDVIYDLDKCVKDIASSKLQPLLHEETIGSAEVRVVFKLSRNGTIAGSHVLNGEITRNAKARLIRKGVVIAKADITSLQIDRVEHKSVKAGHDCGIKLSHVENIIEKDIIEAYKIIEEKRYIN